MSKKMAIASLSYDPATDLEIYPTHQQKGTTGTQLPGTIPMNAAASKPAPSPFISRVKRYVARAVNPLNPGAKRTHTLRISTGKLMNRRILWMMAEVTMRPGYKVPPATLPRGYHDRESNQFQNDWKEVLTRCFDARKLNHLRTSQTLRKKEGRTDRIHG